MIAHRPQHSVLSFIAAHDRESPELAVLAYRNDNYMQVPRTPIQSLRVELSFLDSLPLYVFTFSHPLTLPLLTALAQVLEFAEFHYRIKHSLTRAITLAEKVIEGMREKSHSVSRS